MTTNPPDVKITTFDDLTERARLLADARNLLATSVNELNNAIEALKADAMPDLRQRVDAAAKAWDALSDMIGKNPELFVRPRTVSVHGIKFGLKKSPGKLVIADEDKTVALIRKKLPDQASVLITTREVPVKDALTQLKASELKSIGVELVGVGDVVVISAENGAVDRLVKALIKNTVDEGDDT